MTMKLDDEVLQILYIKILNQIIFSISLYTLFKTKFTFCIDKIKFASKHIMIEFIINMHI